MKAFFRTHRLGIVFGVVVCAVLPYANTLLNGFVYDDSVQVLENPYVQSFRYVRTVFTSSPWTFTGQRPSNYFRPIMSFGYLLCYQVFGPSAWGFHLINILLHLAVVAMVFLVTAQLFQKRSLAFWASVLFALHPIHTESVAWIGAVTDLELTLFYLLTLFFFLKAARPAGGNDLRMQIAMAACFVLAALSKEQALTLPALAMIYEHFLRSDRAQTTWMQKVARYSPLWVLGAAYMLARIRILGGFAPLSQFADLSRTQIVLSAVTLFGHYLWMLVFPIRLCAFYVFRESAGLGDWRLLAGLAATLAYVALFQLFWKRIRRVAFALLWLLVTLLPVLNARWVGENVFAERYLYLPSVGFCWLAAWGGGWLWNRLAADRAIWRAAYGAAVGLVLLLCVLRIVTRNRDWHDNFTLYSRTLAVSPDAYLIRIDLGAVYDRLGDTKDAEREWIEALKIQPNYPTALANLGVLYSRQGLYALAINYLQRAIQANPKYADGYIKLGFTYLQMGLPGQAETQFQSAVGIAPLNLGGYAGLATIYARAGNDAQAEAMWKRALSVNPSDSRAHLGLGEFYAARGRRDEARHEYEAAFRLGRSNPEVLEALQRLGWPEQP